MKSNIFDYFQKLRSYIYREMKNNTKAQVEFSDDFLLLFYTDIDVLSRASIKVTE